VTVDANLRDFGAILLSRNHEETIHLAISSVDREFHGVPVVLVDVGSSDRTVRVALQVAKDLNLDLKILHSSLATVGSLEIGCQELGTKFVFMLSTDDELLHGYGFAATQWLKSANRGMGLNFGLRLEDFSGNFLTYKKPLWTNQSKLNRLLLSVKNLGTAPGAIFNADVLFRANFFARHKDSLIEDHLLWFYLLECGRIDVVDEPLVLYRRHPDSLSSRTDPSFARAVGFSYGFISGRMGVTMIAGQIRRVSKFSRMEGYAQGYREGAQASLAFRDIV
jgi:glycosyltransferase involved in cell wall biosynthesis